MQLPQLVAHRGVAAHVVENTRAALEAALAAGAAWIELDVQLALDGVPVVFHDRTLERLCGVSGAVHERRWEELARLECAERGRFGARWAELRLMRLDELAALLEGFPGARAFVEIKRVALERFGAECVLERVLAALGPARERCVLISFSLDFLLCARARCALELGAVLERWEERADARLATLAPEYLFCDLDGLPGAGELSHPGARLAVYEVGDAPTARALAARGVTLVESFDAPRLLAELGRDWGRS